MAWAHMLSMGGGAFSNPFEVREIMQASVKYDETRTVDQVLAEQEVRHKAAAKPKGAKGSTPPPSPAAMNVQMEKLRELMAGGSPAKPPA